MNKCFLRGVDLHVRRDMQLGRWTDGERENWNWFFVPRTQIIFHRLPNRWRVFKRQGRGRLGRSSIYRYHNDAFSLPNTATRCTIYKDNRNRIHLSGFGRDGPTITWNLNPPHTILDDVNVRGNEIDILDAIRQGKAKIVSDGSFLAEAELGTASWILEGSKGNYIIGQHETPGDLQYQCAHRSEMFGLLGGILTANALCKANGITSGTITAKCDGEGTILIVQWLHDITNNSRQHYDLIHSIKEAIDVSPLTWTFEHIDGHQDDYLSYSQLDRWAQLNVIVDDAAKRKLTNILTKNSRLGHRITIPYTHCAVKWKGAKTYHSTISSHLSKNLASEINKLRLQQYWEKKKNIGELSIEHVDWKHLEKSSKTYKKGRWLAKFVSGICGVGSMLLLWKHQNHSSCPRCGENDEDTQHVLQCEQPAAKDKWKEAIEDLRVWMEAQEAAPDLSNAICKGLDNWKNNNPTLTRMYSFNPAIREAMIEQEGIGWGNLICGFATKKWRSIQTYHMAEHSSRKSPNLWMARLQWRIWEIAWTMWLHRNDHLHHDGKTIHFQEAAAIDSEIQREIDTGLAGLPTTYQYLFNMTPQNRIRQPISSKQEWLTTLWAARDHYTPAASNRCIIASAFYTRWKTRMK